MGRQIGWLPPPPHTHVPTVSTLGGKGKDNKAGKTYKQASM